MLNVLRYFLLITLVLLGFGCASLPKTKTVEIDSGKTRYQLAGSRGPVVIFESGLGDDMESWQPVIAPTAKFARAFAYNRAGFSGSESNNSVRNGLVIVEELRSTLAKLELAPPYVLVGHSLGGGYVELYTRLYPDEVKGLVLVDPNSSRYPEQCRLAKLSFCEPPNSVPFWAAWFLPDAVVGEIEGFATTHQLINQAPELPDIPLVVLSAKQISKIGDTEQERSHALYSQLHKALAQSSSKGQFINCENCSHYIHQEHPDMVVSAIRTVMADTGTQSHVLD